MHFVKIGLFHVFVAFLAHTIHVDFPTMNPVGSLQYEGEFKIQTKDQAPIMVDIPNNVIDVMYTNSLVTGQQAVTVKSRVSPSLDIVFGMLYQIKNDSVISKDITMGVIYSAGIPIFPIPLKIYLFGVGESTFSIERNGAFKCEGLIFLNLTLLDTANGGNNGNLTSSQKIRTSQKDFSSSSVLNSTQNQYNYSKIVNKEKISKHFGNMGKRFFKVASQQSDTYMILKLRNFLFIPNLKNYNNQTTICEDDYLRKFLLPIIGGAIGGILGVIVIAIIISKCIRK